MATSTVLNTQIVPNVPMYGQKVQIMNAAWVQYFTILNQRVGGPGGTVVNSVSINDSSTVPIYTITNTETSGSVAITLTLDTQAPATAFLGPITGADAEPTFRPIATTDLPVVDYLHGGTGLSGAPSGGQLAIGNGSGYTLSVIAGTTNQIHVSNGAGDITLSLDQNLTIPTPTTGVTLTVGAGSGSYSLNCEGTAVFAGAIGVNNVAPPSRSTGWGTPSAGGIVANFPGTGATTAQCGEAISELIVILQSIGFLGA